MNALKKKKLFLLDMDGTIYKEDKLYHGVGQMLEHIVKSHGLFLFITNNSSRSVNAYVEKLCRMGLKVSKENFFTSAQLSALYIREHFPGRKVFCVGTQSLVKELRDSGIAVMDENSHDWESCEVVLIGYDTELNYQKITCAVRLLLKGLPYIATNPDWVCPASFGSLPDCGAICQLLEHSVHKVPYFIGKPAPDIINQVIARYEAAKEDVVVIGDRLYTDIACGQAAGVDTVCVLCGETTKEMLKSSEIKPDYVFDTIADFAKEIGARID